MENDLLNDIIDTLTKSKKALFLSILGIIVIFFVVIVIIWWPKDKDYLTYNEIDIVEKQKEISSEYLNDIGIHFMIDDKDEIKEMLADDYLSYIGKTKDQVIDELDKQGFFDFNTTLKGDNLYIDDQTYVYTVKLISGDNTRNMSIIETYPYVYSIAFDGFYKFDESSKEATSDGIKIKIKNEYRNLKYIEFNLSIENNNDIYARFDFNSVNCVQAVLKDGKAYSAVNLVSKDNYTDVEANMIINKNFVFNIPVQLQNSIEYIVFNGVKLNFSTIDLKINL